MAVQDGTEGQPVAPARREVSHLHLVVAGGGEGGREGGEEKCSLFSLVRYTQVCTHILYQLVHTYIHVCTHEHARTQICTKIHTHANMHMHARMHACMHAHMHAQTHAHTHTHAQTHAHTHTHTRTRTHTHTRTRTRTHTHTHTHVPLSGSLSPLQQLLLDLEGGHLVSRADGAGSPGGAPLGQRLRYLHTAGGTGVTPLSLCLSLCLLRASRGEDTRQLLIHYDRLLELT